MKIWIITFILFTILLWWCSSTSNKYDSGALAKTVKEFTDTADQCLYDTRDSCIKYNESRFCKQLWDKSWAYLDAWWWWDSTPLEYEILYEKGRKTAWMAMAISESNCKVFSVW